MKTSIGKSIVIATLISALIFVIHKQTDTVAAVLLGGITLILVIILAGWAADTNGGASARGAYQLYRGARWTSRQPQEFRRAYRKARQNARLARQNARQQAVQTNALVQA